MICSWPRTGEQSARVRERRAFRERATRPSRSARRLTAVLLTDFSSASRRRSVLGTMLFDEAFAAALALAVGFDSLQRPPKATLKSRATSPVATSALELASSALHELLRKPSLTALTPTGGHCLTPALPTFGMVDQYPTEALHRTR